MAVPNKEEINKVIQNIKVQKLDITILGNLKDFLEVNIICEKDGCIYISQLYLIQQIIEQVHMSKANKRAIPVKVSELLKWNLKDSEIVPNFNYKSLIDKLNYLE